MGTEVRNDESILSGDSGRSVGWDLSYMDRCSRSTDFGYREVGDMAVTGTGGRICVGLVGLASATVGDCRQL